MSLRKQSTGAVKTMSSGAHRSVPAAVKAISAKREKRVQVVFDEDVHTRFKMACLRNGESMSDVINEFVNSYVAKNDPE